MSYRSSPSFAVGGDLGPMGELAGLSERQLRILLLAPVLAAAPHLRALFSRDSDRGKAS